MSDAGVLATVAFEVAARAQEEGWVDRFIDMFRKPHRVIILGSEGVGKSNFIRSLREPLPEVIDALNQTHFPRRHRIKLNAQPFEFVDTPGELVNMRRSAEIRRLIRRKSKVAVISLVAYGFHEFTNADPDQVFDPEMSVREEFLSTQRAFEIELVRSWAPILMDPDVTKWTITLVSKADLWWSRRKAVRSFYSGGEYVQALGEVGALRPPILFYCSVAKRFYSKADLSPGFDDEVRRSLRAELLRAIFEAAGRVERHEGRKGV